MALSLALCNMGHEEFRPSDKQNVLQMATSANHNVLIHINVQDQSITCPKLHLMAKCQYFKALFNSSMHDANQTQLHLDNMDFEAVQICVDHCNNVNKLGITLDNAVDVFEVCLYLGVDDLQQKTQDFVCKNLTPENCLGWCRYGSFNNLKTVTNKAWEMMRKQFLAVSKSDEFHDLTKAEVVHYLQDDDIEVLNEDVILQAAISWIKSDWDNHKDKFESILKVIRLDQCSSRYLVFVLEQEKELLSYSGVKDMFLCATMAHLSLSKTSIPRASARAIQYQPVLIGGLIGPELVMNRIIWCKIDNRWKELSRIPEKVAKKHGSICSSKISLLISGGKTGNGLEASSQCMMFKTVSKKWCDIENLSTARYGHGSVAVGEDMYVIGGSGSKDEILNSVERYDCLLQTWQSCSPMIHGVYFPIVACFDMYIIVIMSKNDRNTPMTHVHGTSVQLYSTVTNQWKLAAPLPQGVDTFGAQAVVFDNSVYLIGGKDKICCNYDIDTDSWKILSGPETVHCFGVAISQNGKILLQNGATNVQNMENSAGDVTEEYNPTTNQWKPVPGQQLPIKAIFQYRNVVQMMMD